MGQFSIAVDKGFVSKTHLRKDPSIKETFKTYSGDIFVEGKLSEQIKQSIFGDCFLLSAILAILSKKDGEKYIKSMMKQEGNYTTVRFYNPNTLQPIYVKVKNSYYCLDNQSTVKHNAPWVHILEKAYTALAFKLTNHVTDTYEYTYPSFDEIFGKGGTPAAALKILTSEASKTVTIQTPLEYPWNFGDLLTSFVFYMSVIPLLKFIGKTGSSQLSNYLNAITKDRVNDEDKSETLNELKEMILSNKITDDRALNNEKYSVIKLVKLISKQENAEELKQSLIRYIEKFRQYKFDSALSIESIIPSFNHYLELGRYLYEMGEEGKERFEKEIGFSKRVDTRNDANELLLRLQKFRYIPLSTPEVDSASEDVSSSEDISTSEAYTSDFEDKLTYESDSASEASSSEGKSSEDSSIFEDDFASQSSPSEAPVYKEIPVPPDVVECFAAFINQNAEQWNGRYYTGSYSASIEAVYNDIKTHLEDKNNNYTLCATTHSKFTEKVKGLRDHHAYAIIGTHEENNLKYIVVRNPWGHTGIKYRDLDELDEAEKDIAIECKENAEFKVELSEFNRHFCSYTVGQFKAPAAQLSNDNHLHSEADSRFRGSHSEVEDESAAVIPLPQKNFFSRHWKSITAFTGTYAFGGLLGGLGMGIAFAVTGAVPTFGLSFLAIPVFAAIGAVVGGTLGMIMGASSGSLGNLIADSLSKKPTRAHPSTAYSQTGSTAGLCRTLCSGPQKKYKSDQVSSSKSSTHDELIPKNKKTSGDKKDREIDSDNDDEKGKEIDSDSDDASSQESYRRGNNNLDPKPT